MKRNINLVFTGIFIVLLFLISILTVLGPQSDESFYEQRKLATYPNVTKGGVWNGTFFSDIETTLTDRIASRDDFLKLNTKLDLAISRPVANNLIVNSDVLLDFYGYIYWDVGDLSDAANETGKNLQSLNEMIKFYGGYFCYLGLPQQSTYFAFQYPNYTDNRLWHNSVIRKAFSESMHEYKVPFIDMHTVFESMKYPANYYLETDHHYTYRGAFAAYSALMQRIQKDTNLPIHTLSEQDMNWVTLPNPFLGSANRKLYGLWKTDEKLEVGYLKNPIPFIRIDNGNPVEASVYTLPPDEHTYATYSVYMGGDIGETIIKTDRADLPNALIFGDSFTNPLETLIWTSFNETRSIDLRHYTKESLRSYIDKYRPDVVICVRDESVYLSSDGNGNVGTEDIN